MAFLMDSGLIQVLLVIALVLMLAELLNSHHK
jgi:hypothetical protein